MSFSKDKRHWEDLGDMDPYWAVLAHPQLKFGKGNINEFLLTGEYEIERVMTCAAQVGHPTHRDSVLDFGCGVGRTTRALAKYFRQCCGIDIATSMIDEANQLNSSITNCRFVLNSEENLRIFSDNCFDMIYTSRVLQHVPTRSGIESYILEFIRILKEDGLLVFQLPSYIPPRTRLHLRRRLYELLRSIGFDKGFLYYRLNLGAFRMNGIAQDQVTALLGANGAKVLEVQEDSHAGPSIHSRTYYSTKSAPAC